MAPRTIDELRRAYLDFFVERQHTEVPSASLIPLDPSLMFTIAGMVPFIPYFTGTEVPPFKRATSSQKCVRAGGKRNDLDDVGHTNRHGTFFEMLGNFSFGDYFKRDAITYAWEFSTKVMKLDPERIWVTIHVSDDEAADLWQEIAGLPAERIQRLDEPNYWRMGDTGPCGPSSELFWDTGKKYGKNGGPALGGEDRYIEFWNLVFMQFEQLANGEVVPLPKPCVDTGCGLERLAVAFEDKPTIWDLELFQTLIHAAEKATGTKYGKNESTDVSLRILADHARSTTFLVSDGVVPSNEDRGYVLRRIIRRAIRHAYLLGAHDLVTPTLIAATVEVMGAAYPELVKNKQAIIVTAEREEERFRQTLQRGLDMLDELLAKSDLSGQDAFFLHDTLGFPIDLSREIAEEHNRSVNMDEFEKLMGQQRTRAKTAHADAATSSNVPVEEYRAILDAFGPTEFTGREEYVTADAKIVAVFVQGKRVKKAPEGTHADVILDRTPFYAESGGQIGDIGLFVGANSEAKVVDTQYGLPGTLYVHSVEIAQGELSEDDSIEARIDGERRDAIRRNHTATHILHWALREVLGKHVKQAGSLVAPDRLRFDFSHHQAVTQDELDQVEALANNEIISDAAVRHYETTMAHAQELGAIAFFGEKYGDVVRVLEAGEHSIELCGGTHVHRLGFIGPIKIVSEGSIGANMRRIEAFTGSGALEHIHHEELEVRRVATLLKGKPEEVPEKVEKLLAQLKLQNEELAVLRTSQAFREGKELANHAINGILVERRDGTPDELRRIATAARDVLETGVVVILGLSPDGAKACVAVAVTKNLQAKGTGAADVAAPIAKLLGGGTSKNPDVVVGGGPNVAALDEAEKAAHKAAKSALK